MRKATGIVLILLWLLASVALWAGELSHTLALPGTGAVALNVSQAQLLAFRLSTLLRTLLSAYVSVALAGLCSGVWLLGDGVIRRGRLTSGFGAGVLALEAALGLFTWLRLSILLNAPGPAGPITDVTQASAALASVLIPSVFLLALALGAILLSAPIGRRLVGEFTGEKDAHPHPEEVRAPQTPPPAEPEA